MSMTVGSSSANTISFADIVQGRNADVRVTVDGLIYAVDLVMVVTAKNCNHANETLRCLDTSLFNNENFVIRSRSKLVSFQHAIELIMVLPGQVAKEIRVRFADIIRRYMAGDESLINEIRANAESSSPLAQMARASLQDDAEENQDRKRRRLTEDAQYRSLALGNISTAMDIMSKLNPAWRNNGRLLMQLEDQVKNIVVPASSSLSIADGHTTYHAPITISDVALDLGRRLNHAQLIQAGKLVAKAYRQRHNEDPYEELRYVDGTRRMIKSYTAADRDLVEDAIASV
jgi:hypothetical protein